MREGYADVPASQVIVMIRDQRVNRIRYAGEGDKRHLVVVAKETDVGRGGEEFDQLRLLTPFRQVREVQRIGRGADVFLVLAASLFEPVVFGFFKAFGKNLRVVEFGVLRREGNGGVF